MEFDVVKHHGHRIPLLMPVELGQNRTVRFHYNYFEDVERETVGYDAESCALWSGKVCGVIFCKALKAAYSLYEVYDVTPGCAHIDGTIIDPYDCFGWLNSLLGTSFSIRNRSRLWELAENVIFEKNEDISSDDEALLEELKFSRFIPMYHEKEMGGTELADLLYIIHGTADLMEEELSEGTYPAHVKKCREAIALFLAEHSADDLEPLWNFLTLDYDKRAAETSPALKTIAELSLFMSARVFVYLAAELCSELPFWKTWKELKDRTYRDEHACRYASQELVEWRERKRNEPVRPIATADYLRRHDGVFDITPEEVTWEKYYLSDADRLYWWDGTDEVRISPLIDEWLKNRADGHREIMNEWKESDRQTDFLSYFLEVLDFANSYYGKIYPFRSMFYEFMQEGDKKEYRAAVKQFQMIAEDEENKEIGEIIKYAGNEDWDLVSKEVIGNPARMELKRYLSVMANRPLRKKYFGF